MKSINHALDLIKEICGSLLNARSSWDRFRCSRCRLPLSDFASIQNGVGPICRNKDTALFAKTMKANYLMVLARTDAIALDSIPEVARPVWKILVDNVIPAMSAAVKTNPEFGVFTHCGNDMRGWVQIIDWILSFPNVKPEPKKHLIDIVRQLGYVAVAAVMEGKASTGESKIWFGNGYLYLQGSGNKSGYAAMKLLNGSTLPKYRGDHTPYQVPAKHHVAFMEAAMTYWPCFEEKIEEVTEQAVKWLENQPKIVILTPAATNTGFVKFLKASGGIEFTLEWEIEGRTRKVVESIKTIPYNFRKYHPNTKSWFVADKYKTTAEDILKLHYGSTL